MRKFWKEHTLAALIPLSLIVGILIGCVTSFGYTHDTWSEVLAVWTGVIFTGVVIGIFFVYPVLLSVMEIIYLFLGVKNPGIVKKGKMLDGIVLVLGFVYTAVYGSLINIVFTADWTETLYNAQIHTPVFTQSYLTLAVIAIISLAGYLALTYVPLGKLPPLVIVCGMAAIYLGMTECFFWILQVTKGKAMLMSLAPLDFILIGIKTVRNTVLKWNAVSDEEKVYCRPWLAWCSRVLGKAERWPVAAFFLMWPLLGILIGLLALFGQQPDAVIRAWTETSDWNLSLRAAPQNIYYDEHYLCTVAAGGHEQVVKPKRLGVRHGHEVIVNRQLCVANAFEQILEERTPHFHRYLRHFYDTYGFPVAKLIHSPYAADLIYFIMKPLEWIFLIVLYFSDVNPENRIAVQYTGRLPEEVKKAVG